MNRGIGIGVLVVGLMIGWLFFRQARVIEFGGESMPLFSSFRYDPYGSAAFYTLLSEAGKPVQRWDSNRIPRDDRGVLIQVQPIPRDISSLTKLLTEEANTGLHKRDERILKWVADGNRLIQFTYVTTPIMNHLALQGYPSSVSTIRAELKPDLEKELETKPAKPDGLLRGRLQAAALHAPMRLAGDEQEVLLRSKGGVVGMRVKHGDGDIVIIGSAYPITNAGIGKADNLDLLLALVGEQSVYIDEYLHGVGKVDGLSALIHEVGMVPFILQLLFLYGLYAWHLRGMERTSRPLNRPARHFLEQVDALGWLYRNAMDLKELRQHVVTEIHQRLAPFRDPNRGAGRRLPPAARDNLAEILQETESLGLLTRKKDLIKQAIPLLERSHIFLGEHSS